MGFLLRRTSSTSRRANSTNAQSGPSNSSPNNNRSNTTSTTTTNTNSSCSSSSSSSSRRITKNSRKTRSRSSSPGSPRNNYYLDNPYQHHIRPRQAVMMVPNSLLPVTAYFPRDYEFEFEDEGYDSSSSTEESSSYPVPALGWRPTQGTLEMEFMFGDMDDEFMQELTRESTPSSDADEMEVDTDSSRNEFATSQYYDNYSPAVAEPTASGRSGGYRQEDRMGGRVVDEDYD